jgi:hypothetical protein
LFVCLLLLMCECVCVDAENGVANGAVRAPKFASIKRARAQPDDSHIATKVCQYTIYVVVVVVKSITIILFVFC